MRRHHSALPPSAPAAPRKTASWAQLPFSLHLGLRPALVLGAQGWRALIGQALDDALRIRRHQVQNEVRGARDNERAQRGAHSIQIARIDPDLDGALDRRRIAPDGRAVPVQDRALTLELLERTAGKVPD